MNRQEIEVVLTVNCSDKPVYAYLLNGTTIFNPKNSECGRFSVDPLDHYGLTDSQVNALHELNKAFNFDDSL
jgi:hypothetical protein